METNVISESNVGNKSTNTNSSKKSLIGGAIILGVSGITAVIAGVITSRQARKRSSELLRELGKEQTPPDLSGSAYALAFKALAWGTVWAVGGCSLIMYGVWKWYGFKDLDDLRSRARTHIRKPNNSDERTEFENLSDFLNYLNTASKTESKASDAKTSRI